MANLQVVLYLVTLICLSKVISLKLIDLSLNSIETYGKINNKPVLIDKKKLLGLSNIALNGMDPTLINETQITPFEGNATQYPGFFHKKIDFDDFIYSTLQSNAFFGLCMEAPGLLGMDINHQILAYFCHSVIVVLSRKTYQDIKSKYQESERQIRKLQLSLKQRFEFKTDQKSDIKAEPKRSVPTPQMCPRPVWKDFYYLRFSIEELRSLKAYIDIEMEAEIKELRQRYAAKRQPILDAIDIKMKSKANN